MKLLTILINTTKIKVWLINKALEKPEIFRLSKKIIDNIDIKLKNSENE